MKKRINYLCIALMIVSIFLLLYVIKRGNEFSGSINTIGSKYGVYDNLDDNNTIKRSFISRVDDLEALQIQIGTYGKTILGKEITLSIFSNNKKLAYSSVQTDGIVDNSFVTFSLDKPILNSLNKKLVYELECDKCESDYFAIYGNIGKSNQAGMIQVGDTLGIGYIIIISIVLTLSLVLLFANNSKVIVEKMTKMVNILTVNWVFFILYFILNTITVLLIYLIITKYKYYYSFDVIKYISTFVMAFIIGLITVLKIQSSKTKIEQLFLLLVIPIGLFYWMFMIPNYIPDEHAHYATIYRMSKGTIIYPRSLTSMPKQVKDNDMQHLNKYSLLNKAISQKNNKETQLFNSTSYSVISYFPGVIGVYVGDTLHLNYFISYYLARLLTFITIIFIGYFAIKKIPFGKMLLCIYMLNPMYLHQGISLSADSIINVFCLFYIAYMLSLIHSNKVLDKRRMISVLLLSCIISLLKYVYIPLVALNILLIKKDERKNNVFVWIVLLVSISLCSGLYLYNLLMPTKIPAITTYGADAVGQIKYIIKTPLHLPKVFITTLTSSGTYYLHSFLGAYLGWLNIPVSIIIVDLYMILLIISPFLIENNIKLNNKERLLMVLICMASVFIILFGAYISWTGVGQLLVNGIQGRYFIPVMILPFLAFCDKCRILKFKHTELWISLLLLIVHYSVIKTIILFFL